MAFIPNSNVLSPVSPGCSGVPRQDVISMQNERCQPVAAAEHARCHALAMSLARRLAHMGSHFQLAPMSIPWFEILMLGGVVALVASSR